MKDDLTSSRSKDAPTNPRGIPQGLFRLAASMKKRYA